MPSRLSAIDSISPAFARTRRMLFRPFHFGVWARLAVMSVVTGEFASGGGSSGNFNAGPHGNQWPSVVRLVSELGWDQMRDYFPLVAIVAVAVLALLLSWVYCDSVYRFIILDAVLSDQCGLRNGWRRWRSHGRRYFLWAISFIFGALAVLGLVVGVPVYAAFRAGWFENSGQHVAALVSGGILLFLLFFGLVIVLAVADLFARDFLVPVMAVENVGVLDGWRRLLPMLRAERLAYGGYALMKIVLAAGSAILFSVVNLLVILLLMIPLGLVGVTGFLIIGRGAGLTWSLPTTLLVGAFGILVLVEIFYVIGFVYAPGLVFFQSYSLEFFGSRYAPLRTKLFPVSEPHAPPAEPSPA